MLYTTYRPQTLDDVVGQEENLITIKEQIKTKHFESAYLFAGHRGTGKTTIARILARTICCENPNSNGPCNVCRNCKSILNNDTVDCIELDAASNNSITDIKDLISSTLYLPTSLPKKIYIIDEVHNLSSAAFDALLKTIEEPPVHCIFILCTTELHKIPATIRSRCSIYTFSALSHETICKRLKFVLNRLNKKYEEEAVNLIARQADGSMRDALSIAEKLIISSDILTEEHVKKTLCLIDDELTLMIIDFLISENSQEAIILLQKSYEEGKSLYQLVENVLQGLTDGVVLFSTRGKASIYRNNTFKTKLYELINRSSLEMLFWYIEQLSQLREQIRNSINPYIDVVLYIMRCCNPHLLDGSKNMVLKRIAHLEKELNNIKQLATSKNDAAMKNTLNISESSIDESSLEKETNTEIIDEDFSQVADLKSISFNEVRANDEESNNPEEKSSHPLDDEYDEELIEATLSLFRDYL